MQIMWVQKIIASFNVGREFAIESFNVVPLKRIKAGPCDYESGPLHLAPSSVFVDRAVLASFLQHKFNIFEHAILTVHNPETIPAGQVLEIAKSVGLNISKLKKDIMSKVVTDQLRQNIHFFLALHQNHIPVIQIYKANNPTHFSVFTGAVEPQQLQRVINNLGGQSNEER